jgi:hypothetical protein
MLPPCWKRGHQVQLILEGASDNTTALKERTLDNIEHADIEEDPSASSADSQLAILKCPPSEEPQPSP